MNTPNGFFWLLVAFPIFLLANGRFVKYMSLAGINAGKSNAQAGGFGPSNLNSNQAVV